jgi:hypothetical protein
MHVLGESGFDVDAAELLVPFECEPRRLPIVGREDGSAERSI